jgi:hypothetical protein
MERQIPPLSIRDAGEEYECGTVAELRPAQVMVLADGFSWNGKTYPSLSKVAFAMTGTRWSGPRFFGIDKSSSEVRP